jgi:hypothetical protein
MKKLLVVGIALASLYGAAYAADATSVPANTAPRSNPSRQPDSTGVEPATSDIGTSKSAPAVAPGASGSIQTGTNINNTNMNTNTRTNGNVMKTAPSTRTRTMNVQGTVESMSLSDPKNSSVMVRDANGNLQKVAITDRTTVMVNGKKTRVSTLRNGDSVTFTNPVNNNSTTR